VAGEGVRVLVMRAGRILLLPRQHEPHMIRVVDGVGCAQVARKDVGLGTDRSSSVGMLVPVFLKGKVSDGGEG
jgi:hypothetical protein